MEILQEYHLTGLCLGAAGGLLLLQLLVADVAGMKTPHTPGAPIPADHTSFWFRSTRSYTNMNESIAIFIIFSVTGALSMANPIWLGRFALMYLVARTGYMFCYWLNIKLARSGFFGISILALLGMGITMIGGLLH